MILSLLTKLLTRYQNVCDGQPGVVTFSGKYSTLETMDYNFPGYLDHKNLYVQFSMNLNCVIDKLQPKMLVRIMFQISISVIISYNIID